MKNPSDIVALPDHAHFTHGTPMDLTVIIATADRPLLLEHAIRSVLTSAARALPIVRTRLFVIDDSASGSAEPVAAEVGVDYARNPRRDDRRNPSAARAWALEQVDSEYVALFDDDDCMLDDHIARLAGSMGNDVDVCSTGYWLADPDPSDPSLLVPRHRQLLRQPRLGDLLRGYQPVNDQAMLRTKIVRSVTWDPERENTMMYHVWLQLLLDGRKFVTNRTATFLYRQHPTSLSHTLGRRDAELRRRLLAECTRIAEERFGRVPDPSLAIRGRIIGERMIGLLRDRRRAPDEP
ncbi:MAG: glycosyltransferase [Candidatus Limnocylindrales bacterium]